MREWFSVKVTYVAPTEPFPVPPEYQSYLALNAKPFMVRHEVKKGIFRENCGIYKEGKALLFRGNIDASKENIIMSHLYAAEKTGIFFRFGPPSSFYSENCIDSQNNPKVIWGVYIEAGQAEIFNMTVDEITGEGND